MQLADIGANLTHASFRDDLDAVLERARAHGVAYIVVTGTTVEVLAVVRIDGKPVKTGRPGPVTSRLCDWFAGEYLRPAG